MQYDFKTRSLLKHGLDERSPALCPQDRRFSHLTKDGLATHLPGMKHVSARAITTGFEARKMMCFHHDRCSTHMQQMQHSTVFCQVEQHTKVRMLHQRCSNTTCVIMQQH
jgi:hypothetical protein